jgi:hypothetical protein
MVMRVSMATILDFRALPGRPATVATRTPEATAEIVIFPGIRYERWDDQPVAAQSRAGGKRKRDRIEIDD